MESPPPNTNQTSKVNLTLQRELHVTRPRNCSWETDTEYKGFHRHWP